MPDTANTLADFIGSLDADQAVKLAELALDRQAELDDLPPLSASSNPPPPPVVLTPIATKRPASTVAIPKRSSVSTVLTASGAEIDERDVPRHLADALNAAKPGKCVVARVPAAGEIRTLGGSPDENRAVIAEAQRALVASGGVCAPPMPRYQLDVMTSAARPVRDLALTSFQATRGAVTFFRPPAYSDVLDGATSVWTMDNDRNPTSPTTKPYYTLGCDEEATTVEVEAIIMSMKVGTMRQRYWPEQVAATLQVIEAKHAALAETRLLNTMIAGSIAVSSATVLGTLRDLLAVVDRLKAGYLARNRLAPDTTFVLVAPSWVRDACRVDVVRLPGGQLDHFTVTDAQIDTMLSARGVRPVWSPDLQPLGEQGIGPVAGWPSTAQMIFYATGVWAHVDGGQLDLGVIYDSTLIQTNNGLIFSESFEGAAMFSSAGSFVLTADFCPNGLTVAADDIDVCTTGS